MKRLLFVLTAVLALVQLMTAVIGWPGGDTYSLVIKPYPSLLKQIPHMEESGWENAVASGEVPKWVIKRQYIELASSGDEVASPPLVRIYVFSQLLTVAAVAVTLQLALWRCSGWSTQARQRSVYWAASVVIALACAGLVAYGLLFSVF